ncbi:MAG: YeeE/YedE family protein [FCB group bacterium]|nr:YeeE/YedE family protein [FCB group bacterium]
MKSHYMNPYLAGLFLGLVLLFAFFFSGRGLGASGALKRVVIETVGTIAPEHASNSVYFSKYIGPDKGNPLNHWLVYEMLGVVVGGFLSGALAGRLKWKVEHSPGITSKKRLIMALIGGILFGYGSQLGRGCTSGAALTGMAVLSVSGFVTMASIFGTAFLFAYVVRKNWI